MKIISAYRRWIFAVYAIAMFAWLLLIPHDPNLASSDPANQLRTIPFQNLKEDFVLREASASQLGEARHFKKTWSLPDSVTLTNSPSARVLDSGAVFLANGRGEVLAFSATGTLLWKFKPYSLTKNPSLYLQITEQGLIISSSNGTIYKLHPLDGHVIASTHVGPEISGPVLVQKERLVLPVYEPQFHASFLSFLNPTTLAVTATSLWIPFHIDQAFATAVSETLWVSGENGSTFYDTRQNETHEGHAWPKETRLLSFVPGENSAIVYGPTGLLKVLTSSWLTVWQTAVAMPKSSNFVTRSNDALVFDCETSSTCALGIADGLKRKLPTELKGQALAFGDDYFLSAFEGGHIEFWSAR